MTYRHVVAIHGVRGVAALRPGQVRHQLMTEKIVVDPLVRPPAARTAEQAGVERVRGRKIINGDGQVEWLQRHLAGP